MNLEQEITGECGEYGLFIIMVFNSVVPRPKWVIAFTEINEGYNDKKESRTKKKSRN